MGKKILLTLTEKIGIDDSAKSRLKSEEKNKKRKPVKEQIQYIGTKDKEVVSEIYKIRNNKSTIIIHRLWKRFGGIFKKVHEHEK